MKLHCRMEVGPHQMLGENTGEKERIWCSWDPLKTWVLKSRKDSRTWAAVRQPDGGQGHSAGLRFGPLKSPRGHKRERKSSFTPTRPNWMAVYTLSRGTGRWQTQQEVSWQVCPPARVRAGPSTAPICTNVSAQPLLKISLVSTKFSHKNIFRKYSQFIEL